MLSYLLGGHRIGGALVAPAWETTGHSHGSALVTLVAHPFGGRLLLVTKVVKATRPSVLLDLIVLSVAVQDADAVGTVADTTGFLAKYDVSIRQTTGEDPGFTDEPKLHVTTAHDLPVDLVNDLRDLPSVRRPEFQ